MRPLEVAPVALRFLPGCRRHGIKPRAKVVITRAVSTSYRRSGSRRQVGSLLVRHRHVRSHKHQPALRVAEILALAKAFHGCTRGLPGGSSLAQFLAEFRAPGAGRQARSAQAET